MSPPLAASGFWHRLLTLVGRPTPPEPSPPPLFRLRPVPPVPAKGPGLPPWDEILIEPPPITEIMRRPHLPVAAQTPAASVPALLVAPSADRGFARRVLTAEEGAALKQIRGLFTAGSVAQAAALVESVFASRPDACDGNGLPVHLSEALRCALALGDMAAARRLADRLRPHLPADDPLLESLSARAAMQRGDRAQARAAWLAALARAPGLPEAAAWLAGNPVGPQDGIAAIDLIEGERPLVVPPPALDDAPSEGAKLPSGTPARLLADVAVSVGADGGVAIDAAADPVEGSGPIAGATDLAVVLRHPEGLLRPHAFIEAVLALFVVQRAFLPHLRVARIYVGRQSWALKPGTALQPELLAVLFPGARVVGDFDGAVPERHALLLDGGERNPATGTLIGGFMPAVVRRTVEARQRIFAAFGLPDAAEPPRVAGRPPRALFLQSPPPRALAEPVRERLFEMLRRAGYEVAQVDMATIPWRRQVRLACGADLIVGAHGPAMSSLLWAHPQARVLEFFPEGTRRYDGQLLAEAAALAYLGLEGVAERGFVIRARERWGPPVGKANRLVWALPWTMLEQALAVGSPAPVPPQ